MSRFIRLAVPAAILAAIAFVAMPREASSTMHLTLRSSIPSKDTVLTASPKEISLTYSQAPMLRVTRVTMTGPDSAVVKVGAPALAQGSTVTVVVPVEQALPPGSYTINWTTASSDGHPIRGAIPFRVGQSE